VPVPKAFSLSDLLKEKKDMKPNMPSPAQKDQPTEPDKEKEEEVKE